jgi:hypothetical protein
MPAVEAEGVPVGGGAGAPEFDGVVGDARGEEEGGHRGHCKRRG